MKNIASMMFVHLGRGGGEQKTGSTCSSTRAPKAEPCEALVEALAEAFPGSSLLGDAPAGAPADAPRDSPKCPEFSRRLAQGGSWWPTSARVYSSIGVDPHRG